MRYNIYRPSGVTSFNLHNLRPEFLGMARKRGAVEVRICLAHKSEDQALQTASSKQRMVHRLSPMVDKIMQTASASMASAPPAQCGAEPPSSLPAKTLSAT